MAENDQAFDEGLDEILHEYYDQYKSSTTKAWQAIKELFCKHRGCEPEIVEDPTESPFRIPPERRPLHTLREGGVMSERKDFLEKLNQKYGQKIADIINAYLDEGRPEDWDYLEFEREIIRASIEDGIRILDDYIVTDAFRENK